MLLRQGLGTYERQGGPGPAVLGTFERQVGSGTAFWTPLNVKLALKWQFWAPLNVKLALDWRFGAPLNVKMALERRQCASGPAEAGFERLWGTGPEMHPADGGQKHRKGSFHGPRLRQETFE